MVEPLFDPSIYTSLPILTLASLVVLARTLATTAPRGLSALVQRTLAKLEKQAEMSQAAQAARMRTLGTATEDVRALDSLADRAVSAIRQRLEAYAMLPAEEFPQAARAGELITLLFPEGLGFLNLPYIDQLAQMEILLGRIDDEKLAHDLDALCGPEFLRHFRAVLPRYRAMVQGGLQRLDENENLRDHRVKLSAAIVDYATKIAATYDEEDPKSLERIRSALRPIDVLRAQATRRPGGGDLDPQAPSEPAPAGDPNHPALPVGDP